MRLHNNCTEAVLERDATAPSSTARDLVYGNTYDHKKCQAVDFFFLFE